MKLVMGIGTPGHRILPAQWRCEILVSKAVNSQNDNRRPFNRFGAPGRTRTSTMFPPPDFESGASTNSATGAISEPIIAGGGGRSMSMQSGMV